LVNVTISARETNMIVGRHEAAVRLLQSSSGLTQEQIREMSVSFEQPPVPVVSVRTCVYDIRAEGVLTTTRGQAGAIPIEEKTLVTSNEVFHLRLFAAEDESGVSQALGEIQSREPGASPGTPLFLSKAMLADWIRTAPDASCTTGVSSRGEHAYIVSLPPPRGAPIASYKLVVRTQDMRPVELNSYFSDGRLYSATELAFSGAAEDSLLCERATTRIYSAGSLFREITWQRIATEPSDATSLAGQDLFFPPGTLVSDRRYSKPMTYTRGTRPPDRDEINAMLNHPRGVVRYELATQTEETKAALLTARSQAVAREMHRRRIRLAVLSLMTALSVIAAVVMIRHCRANRNTG
jgi:hypothetical protein